MPRSPTVWLRRSRGVFFTTIDSRQVNLEVPGPDTPENRALAEAALARLLGRPEPTPSPSPSPTSGLVRTAVEGFLSHCEKRCAAGRIQPPTLRYQRAALTPLVAEFGSRPLAGLTPEEVEEWADRPAWSPSTRNLYLGVIRSLAKWAGVSLKVRRPPMESRGADVVLTAEQFAAVLADLRRLGPRRSGDMAELLTVLRATGARPGELASVTADEVDWPVGCIRRKVHKTRRKTGRDRIIHLNSEAMAVLRSQLARYGTGAMFRSNRGTAYTAAAVTRRLLDVSKRLGFRVIAYGAGRHSFATQALVAGVPDAVVAALLGHRGTTMVHSHYSHVDANSRVLKDAAEKVSRPA